jgi:hypothetical protein
LKKYELNFPSLENKVLILLFFAGFLMMMFALLRIHKWDPVNLAVIGASGLLCMLVSLDLFWSKKIGISGIIGIILAVTGICWYYIADRYVSDPVAVFFALGVTLIILDMVINFRSPGVPCPAPAFSTADNPVSPTPIIYRNAIESKLNDTLLTVNGLCTVLSKEVDQKDKEVKQQYDKFFDIFDKVEAMQHEMEHPTLTHLHNTILEHLEDRQIYPMVVTPGDTYDPRMHREITPMPKLGMTGRIIKTEKTGFVFRDGDKTEVVRKAIVDVAWE